MINYQVMVDTYDENGVQPFSYIAHDTYEQASKEIDEAAHNPKYSGYSFWIREIDI